jgi:putative FmdB family regulatory protein
VPIYEFYCRRCHRIFNYLSRGVNTTKRPTCPRCRKTRLQRRASSFAISRGRPEPGGGDDLSDLDDARVEQAIEGLAQEAEGINEDDPRAMAQLMRKFYDRTGLPLGEGMQEALQRMQAGEDPDKIEEEMGDLLEDEDAFAGETEPRLRSLRRRLRAPTVDDTLYEL